MTNDKTTFSDVVQHACSNASEAPPNQDPETGICYGVIHQNEAGISHEALENIYQNGRDLSYEEWLSAQLVKMRHLLANVDPGMTTEQIEQHLINEHSNILDDAYPLEVAEIAQYISDGYEADELAGLIAEHYDNDESVMRYTEGEDVDPSLIVELDARCYLWVFTSLYYTLCRECSPCMPNAGDLTALPGSKKTYCLGPEWFEGGHPPYPIWTVEGDESVYTLPSDEENS